MPPGAQAGRGRHWRVGCAPVGSRVASSHRRRVTCGLTGVVILEGFKTGKTTPEFGTKGAVGVFGRIDLVPVDGCYAMYTRIAVNKAQRNCTLFSRFPRTTPPPPHHLRVRARPVAARWSVAPLASDA
jgi:hypothetical protein